MNAIDQNRQVQCDISRSLEHVRFTIDRARHFEEHGMGDPWAARESARVELDFVRMAMRFLSRNGRAPYSRFVSWARKTGG